MWRTSKSPDYNTEVVSIVLNWRLLRRKNDTQLIDAWWVSWLALQVFGYCATAEVEKAVEPVRDTLNKLDGLYASLDYTAPVRPYDMRAAEQRAFPRRTYP